MTLNTRDDLKQDFSNGQRPSQAHFAALIESVLNKRDDRFHGVWKPGTNYRAGDVVIHDRALWELADDGMGCERTLCSDRPPSAEDADWHLFVLPVEDGDWYLIDIEPDAPASDQVSTEAGDDAPPAPATMHADPRVVRVGIGTEAPAAVLDVVQRDQARLLFGGCARPGATLRLVHIAPEQARRYLAACVEHHAALVTDAPEGFAFHGGPAHDAFCARDHAERVPPLLAIKRDGRVGIGTDEPATRLEVTNGASGRFLFNLDHKPNPALGIVNLRPGCRENYLACGVDNDVAALVTDSDYGFLFRAGGESGTDDHEIDINQGKELVSILPHGKGQLGIGRQPEDYQLDVDGIARGYGFYVDTDESRLACTENLCGVLDKLCELRPVSFEWHGKNGLDEQGRQIGLVAHEVDDVFPEAVKTNRDRTKAVAYHALVPVLIKAVQEQRETIDAQEERIRDLEARIAAIESPAQASR